jgi:hypothetical protein
MTFKILYGRDELGALNGGSSLITQEGRGKKVSKWTNSYL